MRNPRYCAINNSKREGFKPPTRQIPKTASLCGYKDASGVPFLILMKRREKRLYQRLLTDLWQHQRTEESLNLMEVYNVQEKLAQAIMRFERRLKKFKKPYTDQQKQRVDNLRWDISAYRLIGDALASIFIKPYTIQQHCKHTAATRYLIDQSGFQYELNVARQFAYEGMLPIVHQVTNCLRMGDVSIPVGDGNAMIVEAKSGEGPFKEGEEARVGRQMKRYAHMAKLQEEGELAPEEVQEAFPNMYPENMTLVRAETPVNNTSEKVDFTDELNTALKQSLKDGKDRFVNVDGITAYVIRVCSRERTEQALREGVQPLSQEQTDFIKDGQHITTLDIWNAHTKFPHLPPLTRLFDPEVASKLVFGDLLLMTVLNGAKMADYLRSRGIEVDTSDEAHFWKTHVCKIKGKEFSLFKPFQYVMFAAHSTEYMANYCLDVHEAFEAAEARLRQKYAPQ
jgi:hypothetical protein